MFEIEPAGTEDLRLLGVDDKQGGRAATAFHVEDHAAAVDGDQPVSAHQEPEHLAALQPTGGIHQVRDAAIRDGGGDAAVGLRGRVGDGVAGALQLQGRADVAGPLGDRGAFRNEPVQPDPSQVDLHIGLDRGLARIEHGLRCDGAARKSEVQPRELQDRVMQAQGSAQAFERQGFGDDQLERHEARFGVDLLQAAAVEAAGRKDVVRIDRPLLGLGGRPRAGFGLRDRGLAARALGLNADHGSEVGHVQQFAMQLGLEQGPRFAVDIAGLAGDVGGPDLAGKVIHRVLVSLQDQLAPQPIGRRRGKGKQQEGIEVGQRLALDVQARVDGRDSGGVGDGAFDLHLRGAGDQAAFQRERDAGLLKAEHFAGEGGTGESSVVVFATELVLGGVAIVGRLGVCILDLLLGGGVEGASLHVQLERLSVVQIAQVPVIDRQRADSQLARRLLGGFGEDPVLPVIGQPFEDQVRLGQGNARDEDLLGEVAKRDGKLQHLDLGHRLVLRPVSVAEVHVSHTDGGDEAELDVQVRDPELALCLLRDVAFQGRAKPVPVEQEDQDHQGRGDGEQDGVPSHESGESR